MSKKFSERVRDVVRKIPKGEVRSYKEVARLAGSPNAYRAVANVMAQNFDKTVPCHRVIKNDGTPGGYNGGGPAVKRMKLRAEGIDI
jgi:methylated-DNA-[protein]-cysteine S-methyltransferase